MSRSTLRLPFRVLSLNFIVIGSILSAFSQPPTEYTSVKPGGEWLADDGVPIDCHGGNLIYVDSLQTFYCYGEHRDEPKGASCCLSKDLCHRKNEGVVLEKERPRSAVGPGVE